MPLGPSFAGRRCRPRGWRRTGIPPAGQQIPSSFFFVVMERIGEDVRRVRVLNWGSGATINILRDLGLGDIQKWVGCVIGRDVCGGSMKVLEGMFDILP